MVCIYECLLELPLFKVEIIKSNGQTNHDIYNDEILLNPIKLKYSQIFFPVLQWIRLLDETEL